MALTVAAPTDGTLPILGAVVIGTIDGGAFTQYIGPSYKTPCRCATTASITIATGLNAGDAIDGVTLAAGDRVLVKNQATASQNGIYVAGVTPARASDMDAWSEVPGATVGVTEGTANADTVWFCTSNAGGTLGTTAIDFVAFGNAAGSVLYNSAQTLTQAQAGQTLANLSPTGGATGILKFAGDNGGAYGVQWFKPDGTTQLGGIWAENVNDKVHFDFRKRLSFTCIDGTIDGTVIQLGAADGSAGTDIVFLPSQGASSAGATLKNSQTFMLDVDYWSGGARVSGGVLMNAIALDVSGNAALRITPDNLNGSVTNAVVFHVPDGTAALPAIGFTSDADMGIRKDGTALLIQSDSVNGILRVGPGLLSGRDDGQVMRFRTGYLDGPTDCALQLYYANAGLGVVGSGEWFGAAGDAKIFSCLTAGFRIEDAKDIILATGTGTKIGTATGQKLSFWNATPVVQQVLATGGGATVDNVITLLQTLGLCKQS